MKIINWLRSNQKGLTMTEIVIAMAVFGLVGASVMTGLNASSKTIISVHEITVAESLTRTIMEYVKRSDYDSSNFPTAYYDSDALGEGVTNAVDYDALLGLDGDPYYGDYAVDVGVYRPDPDEDGYADDDGIQKITVVVKYLDKTALTTETYKVDR